MYGTFSYMLHVVDFPGKLGYKYDSPMDRMIFGTPSVSRF